MSVHIPNHIYQELVRISRKAWPNEASAFLFEENTIVERIKNEEESPGHFVGDIESLNEIRKGRIPSALFHSHPCEAVPSATDLIYMKPTYMLYGAPWLIMSNKMELRAWIPNKHYKFPIELEVKIY